MEILSSYLFLIMHMHIYLGELDSAPFFGKHIVHLLNHAEKTSHTSGVLLKPEQQN